ncbi:hypothetical protein LZ30DRAFT_51960 [Colletotrichum cereale]|nr:hypothetical protein LZ30DRAFT_51960 [Colletotrichum cereale]
MKLLQLYLPACLPAWSDGLEQEPLEALAVCGSVMWQGSTVEPACRSGVLEPTSAVCNRHGLNRHGFWGSNPP